MRKMWIICVIILLVGTGCAKDKYTEIRQQPNAHDSFQVSEMQPVRFVFPKSNIETVYIYPEFKRLLRGIKSIGAKKEPLKRDIVRISNHNDLKKAVNEHGLMKQYFVFEVVVIEARPGKYVQALAEHFDSIDELAIGAGLTPKESLEFIAEVLAVGGDEMLEDEKFWDKVGKKGKDAALTDLARDFMGIPEGVLPGASPNELLTAAANVQQLGADLDNPSVYDDLQSLSIDKLIHKYLGEEDQEDRGGQEQPDHSGSTGSSSDTSAAGKTGGRPELETGPGSQPGGTGGNGSGGKQEDSTPSRGSGTGLSDEKSGEGHAPSPTLVLSEEQLNEHIESTDQTEEDPSTSYVRVETGQPGSSSDTESSESDNGGETSGEEDESNDSNGTAEGGTQSEGYRPEPDGSTRSKKTWSEMSSEERQSILLVIQAQKNSLMQPVGEEDPVPGEHRQIKMSWRESLAPLIYPADDSQGDGEVPMPESPGGAHFGPGDIVDSLPDPPREM